MYFIGSKTLIWKQFLKDFVLNGYGMKYINYVEPFCGGCNSLCNVKGWRLAAGFRHQPVSDSYVEKFIE